MLIHLTIKLQVLEKCNKIINEEQQGVQKRQIDI